MTADDFRRDRIDRGLSQGAMAEAMGVSVDVVRTLEDGRRPRPSNCLKVARFYDRSAAELFPPSPTHRSHAPA